MLKHRLFRESAVMRNAQPEPLDGLLRVTAPGEWLLFAAAAALLLAAVVWSALASIDRTLTANGVLARPGERHAVDSAVAGRVSDVFAQAGDIVEAGQPIARLAVPELDWRLRVARARVALLEERSGVTRDAAASWLETELAAARAEVFELAAIADAGRTIVSPSPGALAASALVVGRVVEAGEVVAEIRSDEESIPQAFMLLPQAGIRQIAVGMKARVTVSGRDGAFILPAAVARVSTQPGETSTLLHRFEGAFSPQSVETGWLVQLVLDTAPDRHLPDGTPCRIDVIVERGSPLTMLVGAGDGE